MTEHRTDEHRPSMADPAEYDYIAAFYQGDSPWIMRAYQDEMEVYEAHIHTDEIFIGNWLLKSTCDHCGAAFNHGVLFMHTPTQELIHVGHICAANTIGLPDKAAVARKKAEKLAKELQERHERQQEHEAWRTENADLLDWLAAQQTDGVHDFLRDMFDAVERWGKLTDGQHRATLKWRERDEARQRDQQARSERVVNATPVVEGRQRIVGRIISTKWVDGDFGTTLKMLVEMPDGNRVFGTVPAAIEGTSETLPGKQVAFTATVKRSPKDPHFGYFKRPAQASSSPS